MVDGIPLRERGVRPLFSFLDLLLCSGREQSLTLFGCEETNNLTQSSLFQFRQFGWIRRTLAFTLQLRAGLRVFDV